MHLFIFMCLYVCVSVCVCAVYSNLYAFETCVCVCIYVSEHSYSSKGVHDSMLLGTPPPAGEGSNILVINMRMMFLKT